MKSMELISQYVAVPLLLLSASLGSAWNSSSDGPSYSILNQPVGSVSRSVVPGDSGVISHLNLTSLYARNGFEVWVAGYVRKNRLNHSVLASSMDGGNSWTSVLRLSGTIIYEVKFVTQQIGLAVGYSSIQGQGVIWKTVDGGKHWRLFEIKVNDYLVAISFTESGSGWVLGSDGNVLSTPDWGATWSHSQLGQGNNLRTITFADKSNVWVLGDNGQAFQSQDGGQTWRSRGTELISSLKDRKFNKVNLNAISFSDSNHGVIAGEGLVPLEHDEHNGQVFNYTGFILLTNDGGTTWTSITVTNDLGLKSAQFSTSTSIWVVPTWGYTRKTLMRSDDGGKNWIEVKYLTDTADPLMVYFVDANSGWLLASGGMEYSQLYRTLDGGKNWKKLTQ